MFETEDMLPRLAPKPSAAVPLGHNGEIVKPAVPEVSILFGQPPQQTVQQPQQQKPPASFASWKKQMLPRVNFSPILTTELGPTTTPTTSINSSSGGGATTSTEYIIRPRSCSYAAEQSSEPLAHYRQENFAALPQRRSLDITALAPADVLTICAGTQTEAVNISASTAVALPAAVASKADVAEVLALLEHMRQEQQHLRFLCESLVQQQQQQPQHQQPTSKLCNEIGVQCEILTAAASNNTVKRLTPIIQDFIPEEEELAPSPAVYNPTRVLPQYSSPQATPPMAQSTGYRPHTPRANRNPNPIGGVSTDSALPKPNTEKSLVMNELALKYLPQQQLDKLMQEMRLHNNQDINIDLPSAPNLAATAPFRQIDNLASPSPNDISNASYKYLKKYRLLPEEQLGYAGLAQDQIQSPRIMRQQHRAGSPMIASPQQHQNGNLDLENIRNQPKLL